MECPFCNINEEKTKIISEGKYTFIVLSNPRLMKGHMLIIPKRHVENITELSVEEKKELFDELYQKCQIFERNVFKELTEKEKEEIYDLFL